MKIQQIKITAEMVKSHAHLTAKKRRTLIKKYKIRKMSNYDLAKLFNKSVSQIEKDLSKIKKDMWEELKTDEGSEAVLKAIYAELRAVNDEVVETAWNLGSETTQDAVKLGCLKLIRESQSDVIKVMQSLGILSEAAKKVEVSLQDQIVEDLLKDD